MKRYFHTATLVGSHLYIFGGKDFQLRVNDLYDYNMDDGTCVLMRTGGSSPSARGAHTAVFYDGSIYIYGGSNGKAAVYNDLYQYNICLIFNPFIIPSFLYISNKPIEAT